MDQTKRWAWREWRRRSALEVAIWMVIAFGLSWIQAAEQLLRLQPGNLGDHIRFALGIGITLLICTFIAAPVDDA